MKLVEYFQVSKESLHTKVKDAKTPDKVVDILTGEIKRLSAFDGGYIQKLTPSQANVARALLHNFGSSVGLFTGIKEDYSEYIESIKKTLENSTFIEDPQKNDSEQIRNVIIGSLLMGSFGAVVLGEALLAGAIGAFAADKFNLEQAKKKSPDLASRVESTPEPQLQIDTDLLISKLEEQLKAIDELVIKYGTPPEQPEPTLEDHPAALEFFQNCLKQKHQGKIPPLLMEELNYLLESSEIEIQDYDPDSSDNRYQKFEFVPNLDSEDYETIKPALVKGDRVILKGEVREPMSDT